MSIDGYQWGWPCFIPPCHIPRFGINQSPINVDCFHVVASKTFILYDGRPPYWSRGFEEGMSGSIFSCSGFALDLMLCMYGRLASKKDIFCLFIHVWRCKWFDFVLMWFKWWIMWFIWCIMLYFGVGFLCGRKSFGAVWQIGYYFPMTKSFLFWQNLEAKYFVDGITQFKALGHCLYVCIWCEKDI